MKAKILKTEEKYEAALAHVGDLMDAEPDSPEEDELELWAMLVEQYEEKHYPIDPPDPIDAIKFRMEQMGLKQKDLTRYIPAKSKVSEVLSHKRALSLPMIRALSQNLGIPAEVLVQEVQLVRKSPARKGAITVSKPASKVVTHRKAVRKAPTKQAAQKRSKVHS